MHHMIIGATGVISYPLGHTDENNLLLNFLVGPSTHMKTLEYGSKQLSCVIQGTHYMHGASLVA